MGKSEIDDFKARMADQADQEAELDLADVTVAEEDAKAHFEMAGPEPASDDLAGAITVMAMMAGGVICTAAGVDPLEQAEAEQLGKAAAEVARHYPGLEISPKAAAWFGLGMTGFSIMGPRLAQYQARKAGEGLEDAPGAPEEAKPGREGDADEPAPLDAPQSPYKH